MVSKKDYCLIGATTRYSDWTDRVTTLMDYYGIPYDYINISIGEDIQKGLQLSHSRLVPALCVNSMGKDFQVNESSSICEFIAESHPEFPMWPRDKALRALARSAVARMHAGICPILRTKYPTNFVGKYTGNIPILDGTIKEVENVLGLLGQSRRETAARLEELGQPDEGFLFGEFGIADSFFWPVLWQFRSYNLPLDSASPEAIAWMKKMWNDKKIKEAIHDYFLQSENPKTAYDPYDDIFKDNPEVQYSWFKEDWEFTV